MPERHDYKKQRSKPVQPPSAPDEERSLKDNGGNEGGGSIAGQDGPQEQHSSQVVVVGQLVVVANLPVQGHDDEGQHQLIHDARAQKCHIPEVLGCTPLYNIHTESQAVAAALQIENTCMVRSLKACSNHQKNPP